MLAIEVMQRGSLASLNSLCSVGSARILQNAASLAAPAEAMAAGHVAQLHTDPDSPDWAICRVTGTGERASTLCVQGTHTITIDHPTAMGGRDNAPGPVAHFLGSLIGAQQASLHAVAEEQRVVLGKVNWAAEARMDARGVHGEGSGDAEFDSVRLEGEVETGVSDAQLLELQEAAQRRCIVANTLRKAGVGLEILLARKAQPFFFKSSMGTYIP